MKPLNLKEFAESLMLGQHREFAIEILDNLDFVDTYPRYEIEHELRIASEKEFENHEPLEQIGRIIDRLNVLDEVRDNLIKHGFDSDISDEVSSLIGTLCDAEKLLQDAKVWEGDLLESIALLLELVPAYDL